MKNVRHRINNWSDILRENNMTLEDFQNRCVNKLPHEVGRLKEELIVAAYNEGKIPDYSDGTLKYCPVFRHSGGFSFHDFDFWYSSSFVGSRLDFCGPEARENMYDAVNKFLPEYKESRTL